MDPGMIKDVITLPVCEAVSACLSAVCEHVQHAGDVTGEAELRPGPAVNVTILTLLPPEFLQLAEDQGWDHCHDQEQHCDSESWSAVRLRPGIVSMVR